MSSENYVPKSCDVRVAEEGMYVRSSFTRITNGIKYVRLLPHEPVLDKTSALSLSEQMRNIYACLMPYGSDVRITYVRFMPYKSYLGNVPCIHAVWSADGKDDSYRDNHGWETRTNHVSYGYPMK